MPTRRKRSARRTRRLRGGTISPVSRGNDSNNSLPTNVSISSMSTSVSTSNVPDKYQHVYVKMPDDSRVVSPTDSANEVFPSSDFVDAAKIRIILNSRKNNREKIRKLRILVPSE